MIPYGRQNISQKDIDSVVDVLRSDYLTQGPQVPLFEKALADYCKTSHAVAVNSATSALHIASLALDLGPGDILWTSPITFVASANCALYCGAKVDFVDIDSKTYNICPEKLEQKLRTAEKQGKLPKIVVPVHFAGQSCDMEKIHQLSLKYGFKIIEDASHSVGGKYKDLPVGSCKYSEITVFSFHPVKIITTAEGGIALSNSKELSDKMKLLRSHGVTRNEKLMHSESHGSWYYQQIALGFNYRMTDLQAALGLSQLQRLDEFVEKRRELVAIYNGKLAHLPLTVPYQHPNAFSAFHLYPVRLDLSKLSKSKKQLFNDLRKEGLGVNVHYIPVHTQPYYIKLGFKKGDFPNAEEYYKEALSLPLFPDLSREDQDKIVRVLEDQLK